MSYEVINFSTGGIMNNEITEVLKALVNEVRELRKAVEGLNERIDDLSSDAYEPNDGRALQVHVRIEGGESLHRITGITFDGATEGAPLSDIIKYGMKEPLKKLGEDIKDAVDNLNL